MRRDADGLPIVSALERQLSRAIVVTSTMWFALVAAWELFGPLLAGHYASSASVGIVADNMLTWDIPGPVWEYTTERPLPSQFYCHHPWGIFWTTALLMKVFGRHDFICRLAPVLLSVATPPLLFALGRAVWRPLAGAVAALCFVVLPITLAFANFNALEVPVMTWLLVGMWGFVRFNQTGRRLHLTLCLVGFALALHADWPAFVLVGSLLAFALLRGFLVPRLFGDARRFRRKRFADYATWWVLTASLAGLTGVLYLYAFQRAGGLDDLLSSYRGRSTGADMPLDEVLASRRYWIELTFTPIAIVLGKVAAVVCAVRLLLRRYEHEVLPLLVLFMAVAQYVTFKQGADVHVFWPHYFALFFALGMAALADTALRIAEKFRANDSKLVSGTALVAIVVALAIARDGVPALVYARGTGGRFNEKGLLVHSDGAKTAFLRWLELNPGDVVAMHVGMKTTWAQMWTLRRVVHQHRPLPPPGSRHDIYLADTRNMYDELQQRLADHQHVVAVGPFWSMRPGGPHAPIDAFAIVESSPTPVEWYFVSGTEPHRDIVPDPYLTWELRTHFDQPAEPPTTQPERFEQIRVAHNIALTRGDDVAAEKYYQQLMSQLGDPQVTFDNGIELVGTKYEVFGRPLLTLLFRAGPEGATPHDLQVGVRSRVLEAASWSTTMADPTTREVSTPMGLGPMRWRPRFLYSHRVAIRKRPGVETFEFYWTLRRRLHGDNKPKAHLPQASDGKPVEVLRLR